MVLSNIDTSKLRITLFEIHKVGIKLQINLVGRLGQLERKTKQKTILVLQAAESSLYQVVIQSSESSKIDFFSLIHIELDTEASGHQP